MASLLSRFVASFAAIAPVPNLTGLDGEFNQQVGASGVLNGGTTGFKLLVKTSDAADPPVDQDQIGAGLLARWKQNGTLKASITNAGQITTAIATGTSPLSVVSTTVVTNLNADKVDGFDIPGDKTAFSYGWQIADPSTFTVGDFDELPVFIVPAGNTIAITHLRVTFRKGSHTSGGSLTFKVDVRNSVGGGGTVGSILLDNTNNTVRNVYTVTLNQALNTADQVVATLDARSGTITERNVTVAITGTQKFTT